MGGYKAGTADRELDIVNLDLLEKEAEKILDQGAFDYYRGGAGDEWTMRENRSAFEKRRILPRVLMDMEGPDPRTSILGVDLPSPVILAPAAAQGLAHAEAEKATARGAARARTIMCVSTYSNTPIADVAQAGGGAPQWFQFYPTKDDGFNAELVRRAVESGYKAVILTADATVGGNREADKLNHFVFPLGMPNIRNGNRGSGAGEDMSEIYAEALQKISLKTVEKIAARSKLPVIVKGVQSPHDAVRALGAGAAGIYVSNHGGRQLDGGPASFDMLPPIAEAVSGAAPIIFDGGIRRGQHVFKALACGADVVAAARPFLYALALGGAPGVKSVFDFFNRELVMVMQLAGTMTIREVKAARLY